MANFTRSRPQVEPTLTTRLPFVASTPDHTSAFGRDVSRPLATDPTPDAWAVAGRDRHAEDDEIERRALESTFMDRYERGFRSF